jgi:hypothetical protein
VVTDGARVNAQDAEVQHAMPDLKLLERDNLTVDIPVLARVVARVRGLPGECFLRAEVADALGTSPATLRRLAAKTAMLGPSGMVRHGALVVLDVERGDRRPARRQPTGRLLRGASTLVSDVRWVGQHLLPWIGRRMHGVSSGDRMLAKHAELVDVLAPDRR